MSSELFFKLPYILILRTFLFSKTGNHMAIDEFSIKQISEIIVLEKEKPRMFIHTKLSSNPGSMFHYLFIE